MAWLKLRKPAGKVVSTPRKVDYLADFKVKMVALGSEHSIAVTDEGEAMSTETAAAHSARELKLRESQFDGARSKNDVESVAEVFKETSSSSTFLANLGFPASLRRPCTA